MGGVWEKVRGLWRREPKSPEELAEAARLQDEQQNVRLSQTRGAGSAGQNYQSGRGSR
jgi:hypothetical protein